MKRLGLVLLLGCTASAPQPLANQAPTAPAPASSDPFAITLGEATVVEVTDHDVPLLKLHATGQIEYAMVSRSGEVRWFPGGTLGPDAVIRGPGEPLALREKYDNAPRGHDHTARRLADGKVIIAIPGLADAVFSLAPDGAVSLTGRTPPRRWRVDAASPALAHTAFLLFGVAVKTSID
jgi:hypothetical protein